MSGTSSAGVNPPKSPRAQFASDLLKRLASQDAQFKTSMPDPEVSEAKVQPGLGLAQVLAVVMEGYGDRPCLGERATELVSDPATGRTARRTLGHFDEISYRALWTRVRLLAGFWQNATMGPVRPDDLINLIGFASIDFATAWMAGIYVGATLVPMQANGALPQLQRVTDETKPRWIVVSSEYLTTAIELVVNGHRPAGILLFDHDDRVDDDRERLDAARQRLSAMNIGDIIVTLDDAVREGQSMPPSKLFDRPDTHQRLCTIFYTSGSTGLPKGAMLSEAAMKQPYLGPANFPQILAHYIPMNHNFGPTVLNRAISNGGVCYFTKSDLSNIFEDIALIRPTSLTLIPRVCEMLYGQFLQEFNRRKSGKDDHAVLRAEILAEMRQTKLGGRVVRMNFGSAPLTPTLKEFVTDLVGIPLDESFGSTEASGILYNSRIMRPPVIEYKLEDVPELGYFNTDRPHPRGELLVKSSVMMLGYYAQPELTAKIIDDEGFYHTGDIMAEIEPDRLVYVDRRNNVLKLAQAEFVAVQRLENVFVNDSELIAQMFLYGTSTRSFLLAVVVPDQETVRQMGLEGDEEGLRRAIRDAIQGVAEREELHAYEVPRDFIVEHEPFSIENRLLTVSAKFARPAITQKYVDRLEGMYDRMADRQSSELERLRVDGANGDVLDTVVSAVKATLGLDDVDPEQNLGFADYGGDSLAALSFSLLLTDIYEMEVPVGLIAGPSTTLKDLAAHIEEARRTGAQRPSFASIHGAGATTIHAADLTLDKFLDSATLAAAPDAAPPSNDVRSVLVTGATGFLGRFLCLEWLERMAAVDGKVVAIVRGRSDADAFRRLAEVFDSGDADLKRKFTELADRHLEVLNGDLAEAHLGLDATTWQRLAASVDRIVHPAAFVNHVLPYAQLFGPNVVGTAELIRLALTDRIKPFSNVSTVAVAFLPGGSGHLDEVADVRAAYPVLDIQAAGYASGYGMSKWAAEVLLRDASDRFGLPVSIFRCGMILAHSRFAGQINVPDLFTRLLFSVALTGLAPMSFYRPDVKDPHYDGLPVDFIADAIADLGRDAVSGFSTFHVANPHRDGISMDSFIDWMSESGISITRIVHYDAWFDRFTTALKALPEQQRQRSSLPLIHNLQKPDRGHVSLSTERFQAALSARDGSAIPHLTQQLIDKYVRDLRVIGLLPLA